MAPPARGNRLRIAFARELEFGIPGTEPLLDFRPTLPAEMGLTREVTASSQVNRSGFQKKGLPGAINGALSFGHPLTSGHYLEILENLLQDVTKAAPQPGVFQYAFVGDPDAEGTSLWSYLSLPPIERSLGFGQPRGCP